MSNSKIFMARKLNGLAVVLKGNCKLKKEVWHDRIKKNLAPHPRTKKRTQPGSTTGCSDCISDYPRTGAGLARAVRRGIDFICHLGFDINLNGLAIPIGCAARYRLVEYHQKSLSPRSFFDRGHDCVFSAYTCGSPLMLMLLQRIVPKLLSGVFVMLFLVYFSLGWQIGQIDLVALVTQVGDAGPALAKIAWPWGKAITYDEEYVVAYADVEVPCSENPPPINRVIPGEASLIVFPTCAEVFLSKMALLGHSCTSRDIILSREKRPKSCGRMPSGTNSVSARGENM